MKIEIKKLDIKSDQRGWLVEVLSSDDVDNAPLGLIHVTTAKPGFTKGNHYHKRKTEWFCVIKGRGLLRVKDLKSGEEQQVTMEESNMVLVKIPPLVFHSIENTGDEMLYILSYVDEQFNPTGPDTYRKDEQ